MNISVRQAKIADLAELLTIDEKIWPEFRATKEMFQSRLEVFPEGQFVAVCCDQIVGSIYSQLVDYELLPKSFTWTEVTDKGTIRKTHNPIGDSVYGIGLAVLPEFQGTSASRLLIMAVADWAMNSGRHRFLWGARIPGYHKHKEMSVEQYIQKKNSMGRYIDPELALYQKYDANPVRPLVDYIPDVESLNYGVLVVADLEIAVVQESRGVCQC
jgi:GNAT superfamily N-acetyltransferase